MPKKRVLLVDDNPVGRSLVRQLFKLEPNFEISGEAENGREAVEKAENLKPDSSRGNSFQEFLGEDIYDLYRRSVSETGFQLP
jgi:CheY-like chemotaxis protein